MKSTPKMAPITEEHVGQCQHGKRVQCGPRQCQVECLLAQRLGNHQDSTCVWRVWTCEVCNQQVFFWERTAHVCGAPCECGLLLPSHDALAHHRKTVYQHARVPCPLPGCKHMCLRAELPTHLSDPIQEHLSITLAAQEVGRTRNCKLCSDLGRDPTVSDAHRELALPYILYSDGYTHPGQLVTVPSDPSTLKGSTRLVTLPCGAAFIMSAATTAGGQLELALVMKDLGAEGYRFTRTVCVHVIDHHVDPAQAIPCPTYFGGRSSNHLVRMKQPDGDPALRLLPVSVRDLTEARYLVGGRLWLWVREGRRLE